MLIGIVSDIHDNIGNLRSALHQLAQLDQNGNKVEALICCGDLCSPFVVDDLGQGFPTGKIYIVFGNNDGDRYRITAKAMQRGGNPSIEVRGESAALDLGGRSIFVHHFDDVGRLVAAANQHDLVCYGHNHDCLRHRREGASLEVNPGSIMGWHPQRGEVRPTYAVYDTAPGKAEIYDARTGEPVTDQCPQPATA